jgi:hypothetical protein
VITPTEIVDGGKAIGTANNQVVLGILVVLVLVALCVTCQCRIIYLYRQGRKEVFILHADNKAEIKELITRLDLKDAAMSKERIDRITMLMQLMKENIETNSRVANAIENNNKAIADLKEFLREQAKITGSQLDLFQKAVTKVRP